MSECETKFGVGDTVRVAANGLATIDRQLDYMDGERRWKVIYEGGHIGFPIEDYMTLISKADPIVLPGGDDCCNKPLPPLDLPEPAKAPAGYDLGVLGAVLSEAWGLLSAAHAGLICTPPETAAPALVLSMAMGKIESLIGEVREALGEGGDDE